MWRPLLMCPFTRWSSERLVGGGIILLHHPCHGLACQGYKPHQHAPDTSDLTSRYPSSPSLLSCSHWPPHSPSNILSIPLSQGFCASCSLILECSSPWWLLGSHSRFPQVCSSITLAERLSLLCIKKHPLLPPPWASTPFHCFILQSHFIT